MLTKKIINDLSDIEYEYPDIVYKYRDWEDHYHKSIIVDQVVFMASPISFEDKKDCRLLLRYDLMTDKEIYKMYFNQSKKDSPTLLRADHKRHAKEWSKHNDFRNKELMRRKQYYFLKEYNKRFGVLSLTANAKNIAMWNKYSNNGKGFCVGLKSDIMFSFLGGGGKVKYVEELPNLLYSDSFEERHNKQVFYKEKKWEFEQEYRTHKFWSNPASDASRCLRLPVESYNQVIFGWDMSKECKADIIQSCQEKGLNVEYLQACIDGDVVNINSYENYSKLVINSSM